MKFLRYVSFFAVLTLLLFTNCAKRGTITGGPQDSLPPIILSSSPENFSTHFNAKTIQINFDEYIKLNKVNQQLIISPPMETQPEIIPMGYPSKFIKIKIFDTLKPNTTYSFNFGESIQDNNEGNPYTGFKYVFSTGDYIDSLKLATTFEDSYSKEKLGRVNVMLYEAEGFTDSTIYKKKPLYITTSLDSLNNASFENLKKGDFYLIALQEKSSNYKFDPKSDKIGFYPQKITIPTDSTFNLKLFKEEKSPNAYRPTMVSQNKWLVPYEGDVKKLKVSVSANNKPIPTAFTKILEKDSVFVFTPLEKYDSLRFTFKEGAYEKAQSVTYRTIKTIDTLNIKFTKNGNFSFRDTLAFTSNTPLKNINKELIRFYGKDSIQIPFSTQIDSINNLVKIQFDKKENEKYTFVLQPNSIIDFYNTSLKSEIKQVFTTGKYSDFGTITFTLSGNVSYPIIFELLTKDEKVYDYVYIKEPSEIEFSQMDPNKYFVRIIEDSNGNKKWDTGSYLQKRQPEKVIQFPKELDVRANWDIKETLVIP